MKNKNKNKNLAQLLTKVGNRILTELISGR